MRTKKAQAGKGLGLNPPKEEGGGDNGACGGGHISGDLQNHDMLSISA